MVFVCDGYCSFLIGAHIAFLQAFSCDDDDEGDEKYKSKQNFTISKHTCSPTDQSTIEDNMSKRWHPTISRPQLSDSGSGRDKCLWRHWYIVFCRHSRIQAICVGPFVMAESVLFWWWMCVTHWKRRVKQSFDSHTYLRSIHQNSFRTIRGLPIRLLLRCFVAWLLLPQTRKINMKKKLLQSSIGSSARIRNWSSVANQTALWLWPYRVLLFCWFRSDVVTIVFFFFSLSNTLSSKMTVCAKHPKSNQIASDRLNSMKKTERKKPLHVIHVPHKWHWHFKWFRLDWMWATWPFWFVSRIS